MLEQMHIKPSLVCILEQPAEESVSRLGQRKYDPVTGNNYNHHTASKLPKEIQMRLY